MRSRLSPARIDQQPSRLSTLACSHLLSAFLPSSHKPELWHPWPVEPPFIDEITYRWPSDDWPPAESVVIIEDARPDSPIEIVSWQECGGLLDMWI